MGAGAYLEPLVVVTLLFGGAWINRSRDSPAAERRPGWQMAGVDRYSDNAGSFPPEAEDGHRSRPLSPSLLPSQENRWRKRELALMGWKKAVFTPNTAVFRKRRLSRLLQKFPFLVEAWYWALIYWVYQLGRAFTALTLVEGTVHVARRHALFLVDLEKRWHIFWEIPIQKFFMGYPQLMSYVNWLYSFIHIPGTIAFLVWLYYYTITSNRLSQRRSSRLSGNVEGSPSGPALYEARRRTMAVCNLLAFVVFTLWPCMPPRLLSDPGYNGPDAEKAKGYGFVDTVHGKEGASSVWTQNRFCNQHGTLEEPCTAVSRVADQGLAAMPSLQFGYSLLIGLTIMMISLSPGHRRSKSVYLPFFNQSHPKLAPQIRLPSWRRLACVLLGFSYPFAILVAIVATANHFILDAAAGAVVCLIGWKSNRILLNLLPLEDCFLWCLRMHKPAYLAADLDEVTSDGAEGKIAVLSV